jgi:diguanylate cyclase (GGDEF)-like protein
MVRLFRLGAAVRGRGMGVVAIGATVVVLMITVILNSLETERSAARSQRAVTLATAYEQASTAVAAEQSLERQYRLDPSPATRAAHVAAEQRALTSLGQVAQAGNAQDRTLATGAIADNAAYTIGVAQLFDAVDAHRSPAEIAALRADLVAPSFDALQKNIDAASASHQAHAVREVASVRRTGHLLLIVDIAQVLAALALVGAAATTLARSQRRLRAQSELSMHQSTHDSLTGLPNRALFQDRTAHALEASARTGSQVAVMLLDLNRFKDVNDTLGHHFGDLLLGQVAKRFSATVRAGDSVARLGGDEFAVLLCDSSAEDAASAAQRLTDVLSESFTVRDISLDVEVSIGIALAGPDTDVETALRHADVAMYEAKSRHVPFATYELSRDDNTVTSLAMLGDLRRAITAGDLVLHYQPKVTTTGELHSVEALVRWQHPTRGLLAPDAFIPVAENTAVIHPLTEEVLRQALGQVRSWLDRGWTIPVAVNISPASLLDVSFPAQVQRLLDASGVPASMLSLELTEGAMMNDPGRALTVLEALNAMGVCLSIDDFGTGYSSMAYLKALPVRELKIDRSFVMGMTTDENDAVLVRSAVDLGHNLGLHVVAEGVEDAATQAALVAMGCDLMQGYYISRPFPSAELHPWLRARIAGAKSPAASRPTPARRR